MGLVTIGRAEHQEYALALYQSEAAPFEVLPDLARRHADGRYPARIFLEDLQPCGLVSAELFELGRVCKQGMDAAGNCVARFVLAAADCQLDIGADVFQRLACRIQHGDHAGFCRLDLP